MKATYQNNREGLRLSQRRRNYTKKKDSQCTCKTRSHL